MSEDGIDSALRRIEALIAALDNLPDPRSARTGEGAA